MQSIFDIKWFSIRLTAPCIISLDNIDTFIKTMYPNKYYLIGQHIGEKQEKDHIHIVIDTQEDIDENHKIFSQWLKNNYYKNNKMTSMVYSKWTTDRPKTAIKGALYNTYNAITYILCGTIRNNLKYKTNIPDHILSPILEDVQKILSKQENNNVKTSVEKQYYNIIYDTIETNIKKSFNNYIMDNIFNPSINISNVEKQHLQYISLLCLDAIDEQQVISKSFLRYNKLEELILNGMYIYFHHNQKQYPKYFEIIKNKRYPKIFSDIKIFD